LRIIPEVDAAVTRHEGKGADQARDRHRHVQSYSGYFRGHCANHLVLDACRMSFHEKSALACLTSICVVYVPYFVVVFRYPMAALGLIWLSAIGLVVLLGAFHFAIAIATRSVRRTFDTPPVDELDQRIELRAAKWASVTLASAVVTWILYAMYSMPAIGAGVFEQVTANGAEVSSSDFAVPVFMAWQPFSGCSPDSYFANVAYYGGIVIGYRRVASA
jgi:hypothetical protein